MPSKGNKIMKKFQIHLEQKLRYSITVEAENQEDARFKAIPMIIMEKLEKPVATRLEVTKVIAFAEKRQYRLF